MSNNHKYILIVTKYLPILISIICMISQILSYVDVDIVLLDSIITLLYILPLVLLSNFLKFCVYHKAIIVYIVLNIIISILDYYLLIPLKDSEMLILYMIIAGIFLALTIYLYLKYGYRK